MSDKKKIGRCKHCSATIEYWEYENDETGRRVTLDRPFWLHSGTLSKQCMLPTYAEPK